MRGAERFSAVDEDGHRHQRLPWGGLGCPRQVWSNGSGEASVLVALEWRHPPNGLPAGADELGPREALARHLAVLAIPDNGVARRVGLPAGSLAGQTPVTPAMREMA